MSRVLLLQGHPDTSAPHYLHALADAYAAGLDDAMHERRLLTIASLDLPPVRSQAEWESPGAAVPAGVAEAQEAITWAEHVVLFFPLWLGDMPAMVKAFFEQVMRPGFAVDKTGGPAGWRHRLAGRSARVVVTMGMPSSVYRWVFRAHSVKSLERNILGFVGFAPVHDTLIGLVEGMDDDAHRHWLERMRAMGRQAA